MWLNVAAQKVKADSLSALLAMEKTDTARVTLMWQVADAVSNYDPTKALALSRQSLFLSTKIKFKEGQSRSLGVLANTFINIGNYPRALEYNFEKLKLDETRDKHRNLASVLMNIGVVYVLQQEFEKALLYYYKSDSVIQVHAINDLRYYSLQNLGDVYDRLNMPDSAYVYFKRALATAETRGDNNWIGASKTGLGHSYLKQKNYPLALNNYQQAIALLKSTNNDDLFCEASLGLATLYQNIHRTDSAAYFARLSLSVAQQDGFLTRQLEAAEFLTSHYTAAKAIDSAFSYLKYQKILNDTINSKSKIRQLQILSSNEQLRQIEIEENRKITQLQRKQELQLLFIGIFIPGLFLFTVLLSRINIHVGFIKLMGILSLLFLFEYLTLFLHPWVVEITHHTPVLEILIFVAIAAFLIPLHHKIEHALIKRLIHNRRLKMYENITIKKARLKIKSHSHQHAKVEESNTASGDIHSPGEP